MKRTILLSTLAIMILGRLFAQAPQGIGHQAVVRDTEGKLVTNATIGVHPWAVPATPQITRVGCQMQPITAPTSLAFRPFRAAFAVPMGVSTTLATTATGGQLLSTHPRLLGAGACTTATAMCTATTTLRHTASACGVSGIRFI
jgi:hypothetical protein